MLSRSADCHTRTTDSTSRGRDEPHARAFAYSARSLLCSLNRAGLNTRQWLSGGWEAGRSDETAAAEAAESAAEAAPEAALEAEAAAGAAGAAAASCCCRF